MKLFNKQFRLGKFIWDKESSETTIASLKRVHELIDEIQKVDLKIIEPVDLLKKIQQLVRGHSHFLIALQPHQSISRAILYPDDKKPLTLNYLGCNPSCRQNRINEAGEEMFYGSLSSGAPFFELHAKLGEYYALSTWYNNRKMRFTAIGYSSAIFSKEGVLRESPFFANYPVFKNQQYFSKETDPLIKDFISKQFCQSIDDSERHKYNLTNAFSKALGFRDKADGVIYPSIPGNFNADNLAFYEGALKDLYFSNVSWVEVVDITPTHYALKYHDFADEIDERGTIIWKGRPPIVNIAMDYDEHTIDRDLFDENENQRPFI